MELFYDPHEIGLHYGRYISDLRRLFVFHGISCGAPRHLSALASRLESSKPLRADLSAILRSTRDMEPQLTADEMLAILAVAVGGEVVPVDPHLSPLTTRSIMLLQLLLTGIGGWSEHAEETRSARGERTTEAHAHAADVVPEMRPAAAEAPALPGTGVDVRAFVRSAELPSAPPRLRREPLSEIVRPPAAAAASQWSSPSAGVSGQEPEPYGSAVLQAAAPERLAGPQQAPETPTHAPTRALEERLEQAIQGLTQHLEEMNRRIAEIEPRLAATMPVPALQPAAERPAMTAELPVPAALPLPSRSVREAVPSAGRLSVAEAPTPVSERPRSRGVQEPDVPPHAPETKGADVPQFTPAEHSPVVAAMPRTEPTPALFASAEPAQPGRRPVIPAVAVVLLVLALGTFALLRRHRPVQTAGNVAPAIPAARTSEAAPEQTAAPAPQPSVAPETAHQPPTEGRSSSASTPPSAASIQPARALDAEQTPAEARPASAAVSAPPKTPHAAVRPSSEPKGDTAPTPEASRKTPLPVPESTMNQQLVSTRRPVYPPAAREQHLEGTVVLNAVVDTTGSIRRVDVVTGPPALVNSAIAAATWRRYHPFLLHGRPVEVATRITVDYRLP